MLKRPYMVLIGCILAAYLDVLAQDPVLTLILAVTGLVWLGKVILKGATSHLGWRTTCLKVVGPLICIVSFPAAIIAGLECQDIAISRALELRSALVQKLPEENLYKTYSDLCSRMKCGILSYSIIPAESPEFEGGASLVVMQFFQRRATVDIATGNVVTSERTY